MEITLVTIILLLLFVGFDCNAFGKNCDSGHALQIVKSSNHKFSLEIENLKQILEADTIKDRSVVVVSIAGAMQSGKSFLLNFFVRYLCAKVKTTQIVYLTRRLIKIYINSNKYL